MTGALSPGAVAGLAAAAALGVAGLLVLLHDRFALFTPVPRRALRVLMYHRISERDADRATVPVAELARQLGWLRAEGYELVALREVLEHVSSGAPLPPRAVLLTFDDGTADAHRILLPLLRRLGAPAAVFAVGGFTGRELPYDGRLERFCSAEELRELSSAGAEIALHGHSHLDLSRLSPAEVEAELRRCAAAFDAGGVLHAQALAYPYGAYPRKDRAARAAFLAAVSRAGVIAAFRIGNRVNRLPLAAPLEIQRTEVRGDEPFAAFVRRVGRGRRRGFA